MTYYLIRHNQELFQGISTGKDVRVLLKNIANLRGANVKRFLGKPDCLFYTEVHDTTGMSEWRLEFSSVLEAEMFLAEFHRLKKENR